MPIFKKKNDDFFKKWSSEMAYILGFFTADGNMIKNKRGAHFISIEITDKDLLEKIRKAIGSNHKIGARKSKNHKWKESYRLQIGSKTMFSDLIKLGLMPNKSLKIRLPKIPKKYFADFVRGYFDGDGNVMFNYYRAHRRKRKSPILLTRFTSGSRLFLKDLRDKLHILIKTNGAICGKENVWRLYYSANDSRRIFYLMYKNINSLIYLKRKYKIYLNAGVVQPG